MKVSARFRHPAKNLISSVCSVFFVFGLLSGTFVKAQSKEGGVNVGLTYPLSTRGVHAGDYTNIFSLNAIGGVSWQEKAFTASGIYSIIHSDASGFQGAGILNSIGGFSAGVKAAGITNIYGSGSGFQAAGVLNLSRGNITGMQAAGLMNKTNDLHGFQTAGFLNIAKNVKGTQAAGYFNMADSVHGAQLAGYINIAKNVEGVQVAGFINIADKVKGVQVAGLINIADSSEYPIGIINIIKNGEKWIGLTTDDNLTTLVTFRSGSRKLYGIVGLGINPQNTKHVLAQQFGLGAHLFNATHFRLNSEITILSLENFRRGEFSKLSLSVTPALTLGSRLEIFGGPSFNLVHTNTAEGKKLVDHYMWHDTNSHNRLNGFYIGYMAGIHMKL